MESERYPDTLRGSAMSPSNSTLRQGDPIFHPKYGFGTIHSLTRRDRAHPIAEPTTDDAESDLTENYYDIHLVEGGTLLVPIDRAESVGLRLLTNGLEAVKASFCSPARSLPDSYRERAAVLRTREQLPEPTALADCVRDMLAQSRDRALSTGERTWLENSCERLSLEAALVDNIATSEARAAIRNAMNQLSAC